MNRTYGRPLVRPASADLRPRLDSRAIMEELDEPREAASDSAWAVGYLDVLLLLLTLFAALLGIGYMQSEETENRAGGGDWLLNLSRSFADAVPASPAALELEPEILLAAYQARPVNPQPPELPEPAPKPGATDTEPGIPVHGEIVLTAPETDLPEPLLRFDPKDLAGMVRDIQDERLGVEVQEQQVRVEMQDDILFPLGSADLGESGKRLLDRLTDGLASRDIAIQVEGHTDDLPIATARFPSNWELSSYRATTVARYLIERGVERDRIQVSGHADTRPRVPNDSRENRARNRRVSLVLQQWQEVVTAKPPMLPEPGQWKEI
jgi:chemotaxis protein MotB